jgi:hypothetical protein
MGIEDLEGRQLLSTMSAVSWADSNGQVHHEVFALNANDNVEVSKDGGAFTVLGSFQASQVSAGLDVAGNPEVFALGLNNAVYVSQGTATFKSLGGNVREISATVKNTVYALGFNNVVYVNNGSGFVNLQTTAKQISAGAITNDKPEVFAIGLNDGLYVNRGTGFIQLGSSVKQISATMNDTVFALNPDSTVTEYTGGKVMPLGGVWIQQISAGLDALGNPEVFGVGQNETLYLNHGSGGWSNLGDHATQVSAASIGVALSGDVAYFSGQGHEGYLRQGPVGHETDLKGYVQLPSSAITNGLDSWQPVTRDVSAVSWADSNGQVHHEVFALNANDNVEVSKDGGAFTVLGSFQARQVSAGLDVLGNPEVFALGLDNAVYVSHGTATFMSLGGQVFREISASVRNTVYALGFDNLVYVNKGSGGFFSFPIKAKQIGAGTDANGNPEVFAIDLNDRLYAIRDLSFIPLGSNVRQISATMKDTVFALNLDSSVTEYTVGKNPVNLGGAVMQISAGLDGLGNPEVFAVGQDETLYLNHGSGWSHPGEFATEVAAVSIGVALPGDVAYLSGQGHKGYLRQGAAGHVTDLKGLIE